MERELEELSLEDKDKDLLGIGTSTSKLPEVPTHDLKEPSVAVKEKKKGKAHQIEIIFEENFNINLTLFQLTLHSLAVPVSLG